MLILGQSTCGMWSSSQNVTLQPCSLQHCRERPRSMVVIEVFTPVVQRILKHNMVSVRATGTPAVWSFTAVPFVISSCSAACHVSRSAPQSVSAACSCVLLHQCRTNELSVGSSKASKQSFWGMFLLAAVPAYAAPALSHLALGSLFTPCMPSLQLKQFKIK